MNLNQASQINVITFNSESLSKLWIKNSIPSEQKKDHHSSLSDMPHKHEIDINIKISYEKDEILKRRDYLYVLAHAFDFYKAFDDHEWNLFDWNVRLKIKNSSINKKIVSALRHQKSRKNFHHYNNLQKQNMHQEKF